MIASAADQTTLVASGFRISARLSWFSSRVGLTGPLLMFAVERLYRKTVKLFDPFAVLRGKTLKW